MGEPFPTKSSGDWDGSGLQICPTAIKTKYKQLVNECRQTQVRLDKTSEGVVSKAEEVGCRSSAAEARTPLQVGGSQAGSPGQLILPRERGQACHFVKFEFSWKEMLV